MGHLNKLTHSRFLTNITKELRLAREVVKASHYTEYAPQLIADKHTKKEMYYQCMYFYDFFDEIEHTYSEEVIDKDNVYCIQYDHVVFAYSLSHKYLKETMQYLYNVNGDFPFHRSRHRFNGRTVYTVIYDTRIVFTPASPN